MLASVYFGKTDALTTLDIGRHSKIAEIDIRPLRPIDDLPAHLQAKRELHDILRDSQFKNMVESGTIRMEAGVSIADVVKEVKRAVFEQDGITSGSRYPPDRWMGSDPRGLTPDEGGAT